jgi:chemotaxis protein CheD
MDNIPPLPYHDREFGVPAVRLLPGQFHASRDEAIATLLGSCVSACLWDPRAGIGGMNHFMLPGAAVPLSPLEANARFGIHAMEVLINRMLRLGAQRRDMVAKVFGGAHVMQGFESLDVGEQNAAFVLRFLQEEGVPLAARDLGGVHPRKLVFFPATGKVHVKRLQPPDLGDLQHAERAYRERLQRRRSGDFEMFGRTA